MNSQSAFGNIEAWSRIKHPNLVGIKEAFTTRAFNDDCEFRAHPGASRLPTHLFIRPALVVVYDYHPNSQTLYEAYVKPKATHPQNGRGQQQAGRTPERTIWTFLIQIACAIRAVHEAGLAVRVVDPTKVLVTGQNRHVPFCVEACTS